MPREGKEQIEYSVRLVACWEGIGQKDHFLLLIQITLFITVMTKDWDAFAQGTQQHMEHKQSLYQIAVVKYILIFLVLYERK